MPKNLQLPRSLNSLNSKLNRRRGEEGREQVESSSGSVYRIHLAMSNQLSAFCGGISGFMSMAASCWQGKETFITCILQQARFAEEKMMMDSFQCLMKQMTWRLLYVTLNTKNNRSALGYQSTCQDEGFLVSRFLKRPQSCRVTKNW